MVDGMTIKVGLLLLVVEEVAVGEVLLVCSILVTVVRINKR